MPPEGTSPWTSETLTGESAHAFFKGALERDDEARELRHTKRNLSLYFGGLGLFVGALGIAMAADVYHRTPVPPPPGYIFVDKSTGVIDQPVSAKDAPRFFPETVRTAALRNFIVACESYVPETWARIDYHACMIMSSPDEQKRRAADIGRDGQRYPPTVFGSDGWAMPTAFPRPGGFTMLGVVGKEPNQIFRYQVRYERTEITHGKETKPRWTAEVVFSFHPELKMLDADRLLNPFGLQVLAFSTTRD